MNTISDVSENLYITDERRKEIFDIFKTIVMHIDTASGVITEVQEHPDLYENEKSYLIYTFALGGRATIVKMSEMDATTQDKLIEYLKETIVLKK